MIDTSYNISKTKCFFDVKCLAAHIQTSRRNARQVQVGILRPFSSYDHFIEAIDKQASSVQTSLQCESLAGLTLESKNYATSPSGQNLHTISVNQLT